MRTGSPLRQVLAELISNHTLLEACENSLRLGDLKSNLFDLRALIVPKGTVRGMASALSIWTWIVNLMVGPSG
jgi:intracellular sulfur oxidation DsrE/DsrF family protein